MISREAALRLAALAVSYRRRRWLAFGVLGLGIGALAAAVAPGGVTARALALLVAATAGIAAGALHRRRHRIDAGAVARHLNRVVPAVEESADLVLLEPEPLPPLWLLQRQRAARGVLGLEPVPPLPDRTSWRGPSKSQLPDTCSAARGRGSTRLMSPRSTFTNCGSSSTLHRRRNRPTVVVRGSPLILKNGAEISM